MIRLALAVALIGAPAGAQDLVFSPAATETCLAAGRSDCIGASGEACMQATPGGQSTVGMGGCLDRELSYWDARLNSAYGSAMRQAKQADQANSDGALAVLSQAQALREMQRAWIPFRDAKCDFARSQWGGGTGGGPAQLSCLMQETGQQALYLEGAGMGG
ncbi:lysozyme inhibitor LprI family protein [Pseudooceanicola sp.]|uniref:lysozyme inhibitor LprI family protein n=1 Tax=Pseudooceanicola sp. TaxID=1914328 RepID=UPI0026227DE3|nr:lysozyme inhibitor LprI family protein [Pseudooceanicola sp.]MDF1855673.1 DUF1311 domain-containing protein [Pseudooceanicola sp.]